MVEHGSAVTLFTTLPSCLPLSTQGGARPIGTSRRVRLVRQGSLGLTIISAGDTNTYVGQVVPGLAADQSGSVRAGDEIVAVST